MTGWDEAGIAVDDTQTVRRLGAMSRPRTPKGRAREVDRRLAETYPDAVCELDHRNPFELLAATILSAQTTDARVNMVTPILFDRYPTAQELAVADPDAVEAIIKSTGFYANKTKSLIGMATPSSTGSAARCRRSWRTSSPSPASGARPPTSCAAWPSGFPVCRSTPTSGGCPGGSG